MLAPLEKIEDDAIYGRNLRRLEKMKDAKAKRTSGDQSIEHAMLFEQAISSEKPISDQ
jgi:hypothetical protein